MKNLYTQSYIYKTINMNLDDLTKSERNVAEYIMENQDKIIYLGITELADLTDTSEATIIRMCKKLGYKGFQELKIKVAYELVDPIAKINESLSPDDSPEDIISKTFAGTIDTLTASKRVLDANELAKAGDAILKARRILIFGLGNSASVAADAQHKLLRAGLFAVAYSDNHLQMIAAASIAPDDVVIGISHSGSSRDIVEAMVFAKQLGATAICITNYGRSPITKPEVSDIRLFTTSGETKFRIVAVSSRIAQLAILDSLFAYISLKKGSAAIENYERLEQALSDKKY